MTRKAKEGDFLARFWPASSRLPKHECLRRAITAAILDGYWAPEGRLPTEQEWVAATPCSLGTVQRALRDLVSDGLILRRRGSGTTVAAVGHPLELPWHMRFRRAAKSAGKPAEAGGGGDPAYLPFYARIVARRVSRARGPWSAALGQARGAKVVRIERVMVIGDLFGVYAVFHALADRFPELVDLPVSALAASHLRDLMARRHLVPVSGLRECLRGETPSAKMAKACRWPAATERVSVLNVVAEAADGSTMYYQDFFIPPNDCILDLGMPSGG